MTNSLSLFFCVSEYDVPFQIPTRNILSGAQVARKHFPAVRMLLKMLIKVPEVLKFVIRYRTTKTWLVFMQGVFVSCKYALIRKCLFTQITHIMLFLYGPFHAHLNDIFV